MVSEPVGLNVRYVLLIKESFFSTLSDSVDERDTIDIGCFFFVDFQVIAQVSKLDSLHGF